MEPVPNGPEPTRLDWLVAVDVFAVVTIATAVALLWRGSRLAAGGSLLAAAGMAAEAVLCPATGHHVIGWWTWTQWAMTAFVGLAVGALQHVPREETTSIPSLPGRPAAVDRPSVVVVPAPRARRGGRPQLAADRPAAGPAWRRPAAGRERKASGRS